MSKQHKRKAHPRPVITKPEEIKVINEKGEVIHTATLTAAAPVQAFCVVNESWKSQPGRTPAEVAAHAFQAFASGAQFWVNTMYGFNPAYANRELDDFYSELDG